MSKAIAVAVFVVVALFGCNKDVSLGPLDLDAAAGGASGSGGTTSTGGKPGSGGVPGGRGGSFGTGGVVATGGYIITQTGPGGSGGSDGSGGSSMADAAVSTAELCTTTGGTVLGKLCCPGPDFPDSCMVGACSCGPTSSKTINICDCPSGTCFDPKVGCRLWGDAGP